MQTEPTGLTIASYNVKIRLLENYREMNLLVKKVLLGVSGLAEMAEDYNRFLAFQDSLTNRNRVKEPPGSSQVYTC